jgi:hypothetical protein
MPARDPEVRRLSSLLAAEARHHPGDDHSERRRALREAQTAARIRHLAAGLPLEVRARLAVEVLAPSGGGA